MFTVDRITNDGKKAIVSLLNKSIEVKTCCICNYPRLIDQLVSIEPTTQESVAEKLQLLSREAVQHASWIMRLIEDFGGEPQLPIEVMDRIVDVPNLLLKQIEREKLAQSLFQQAKRVAEQSQVEGILAKMRTMGALSPGMVAERSSTIRILQRLEIDEGRYIVLLQNIISELNLQRSND